MQKASIRVYSRPGCHLCEQLVEELLPHIRGRLRIDVVDIDSNAEWAEKFDVLIPVVEFEGRVVCQYTLDLDALQSVLGELPDSPK